MLISLCVPVHNRTYTLKEVMLGWITAAEYSPPVEIVVIDYNSQDDLRIYMDWAMDYPKGNTKIIFKPYTKRECFHMAHARNLSVLASHGDYIVETSADVILDKRFFAVLRDMIGAHGYTYMHDPKYKGVITVLRDEFIAAGGYDERFEFYGPEDREMHDRLVRRGNKVGVYPPGLVDIIPTPNDEKVKHYRIKRNKTQFSRMQRQYWYENNANGVLVANPDGWGAW